MSLPRYPAYKNSAIPWLKELPEHWGECPLKSLLSIENGLDHKEVVSDEGWPVFGSGGPFAQASNYLYDGETILLGRKGTIDKPLYYSGKFWAVDTMYWSKVRPGCVGKFTYFSCLSIPFAYYQTSTALPSMTKTSLGSHPICLPPVDEQLAIASFLDRETAKIDALIAEQQRLIELLQEKRQAVISHAVTKGLNPNAPMKDSGVEWLGEVPEHWEVKRVKQCIDPTRPVTYGILKPGEPDENGIPMIRAQDYSGEWKSKDEILMVSAETEAPYIRSRVRAGDVLITAVGAGTGNCAVIPDYLAGSNISRASCRISVDNRKLSSGYLLFVLSCTVTKTTIELSMRGAAQPVLNNSEVENLLVPLPPLEEQSQLLQVLGAQVQRLDEEQGLALRQVELLQERRSALISAAVTGQIDVRGLVEAEGSEQ